MDNLKIEVKTVAAIKQEGIKEFINQFQDLEAIANASICISRKGKRETDCTNCKYRILEKLENDSRFPADCEINGVKYWEDCDCERIGMDAGYLLKEIKAKANS